MRRGAGARRRHVDLAGIGLGIGDELGDRARRHRGMHQQRVRHARQPRDRREVAREVEVEPLVERAVDGVGGGADQDGVAVGRRVDDAFGRDVAAGARLVLDHELRAEPLGEPLADQARQHVGRPAGRKSDDELHRPGRIVERAGVVRAGNARHAKPRATRRSRMISSAVTVSRGHPTSMPRGARSGRARIHECGSLSHPSRCPLAPQSDQLNVVQPTRRSQFRRGRRQFFCIPSPAITTVGGEVCTAIW